MLLKQSGPLSVGILVNQIWSIAGDDARGDVSLGLAQPFVSYVDKNLGISKPIKGKQPLSIGSGVRYYVERPAGGPDWGARLTLTLQFPQ